MTFSSRALIGACALLLVLNGCSSQPSGGPVSARPNLAHTSDASQTSKTVPNPQTASASAAPPLLPYSPPPVPSSAGKMKVAILLPLTGKYAPLGQGMLNAAQQAVFDVAAANFELMPRDTNGTDEQVDMAARDALASGAQLIIGPLFAQQVAIVHNVAQSNDINMLTLSTDTSLAAPGVYVMGFAPGPQVERVVGYAATHGVKRFAALLPATPYGVLVGQAFQAAVEKFGGTFVVADSFDTGKHDSEGAVRDLASRKEAIDGLFLPEGGADLKTLTTELAAAGFDPQSVHLMGTGLWDVAGLGKDNPFVLGGWYAASDLNLRKGFMDAYTAAYGQEPQRLATLAYDATALAAVLSKRGAKFDQASLTNANGFAGVDGIFRLLPSGAVERGLSVLQVGPDSSRVIDAAPTNFPPATH